MAFFNTSQTYGRLARWLHWLTALGVLVMVPLGAVARRLPHDTSEALTLKANLFTLHKTLGLVLLALTLLRLLTALGQPRPAPLATTPRWQAFAASTTHWMLYASLVLVPLSGWVHHAAAPGFASLALPFALPLPFVPVSVSVADTAAAVHLVASRGLVALALLHVVAALKHTWVDRDITLRRMLSGAAGETAQHRKGTGALALMLACALWAGALWLANARGLLSTPSIATQVNILPEPESEWIVQDGTLALAITQFGERVEGRFEDWTAAISFEDRPEPGPLGDIDVTINTGSLRLGSVSAQATGPDFLDTSAFPNARYTATLMRAADGYVARGILRLRGVEQDLALPFQLSITDGLAEVQGRVVLDRRRFDIGRNMTNAEQLGFQVEVWVTLTAKQPEP